MTKRNPGHRTSVSAAVPGISGGGAEGIRTPDLLIANETRYQLRHSPENVGNHNTVRAGYRNFAD